MSPVKMGVADYVRKCAARVEAMLMESLSLAFRVYAKFLGVFLPRSTLRYLRAYAAAVDVVLAQTPILSTLVVAGALGAMFVVGLSRTFPDPEGVAASDGELLIQRWVPVSTLRDLPPGAVAAHSGDACPPGWGRIEVEGTPMFVAVGLLTDEMGSPYRERGGQPYSNISILIACEKQ